MLVLVTHKYNDLFVPRARLRFGERAFSNAAPLPWNSVPAETRNVATLKTFKKKLKTLMFYKKPRRLIVILHFNLYVAGRLFAVSQTNEQTLKFIISTDASKISSRFCYIT